MIGKGYRSRIALAIPALLILFLGITENTALAIPPIQRTVLSNQLTFLLCEEHSLPFVTFQLLIDSGSRSDPSGKEGLARLAAQGLLLGTTRRTANAINEELDLMGASLNSSSGRDYNSLTLRVLKKDLEKGFDLFMEALTDPVFPEEEIHREIEKTLASIRSAEDNPEEVAEKAFQKALFVNHPYGHPVEGTTESVPRLTREDAANFHRTFYRPHRSILTVVGDITPLDAGQRLLPRLLKWTAARAPAIPFKGAFAEGKKIVRIHRSITQANILLGHAGVSRDNPDFYALSVMNYILGGGGFVSRLVEQIRIKRGLAYAVASFFDTGKYPGSFQIVLQTKNPSAREAISVSLEEMERIQKERVTEKEIEGAKKYLIGSFPLRMDTQAKLANLLTQMEYYGLGMDYPQKYPPLIQSVSREDVLRVARAYLHPKSYILVVVGDLKEAGMDEP